MEGSGPRRHGGDRAGNFEVAHGQKSCTLPPDVMALITRVRALEYFYELSKFAEIFCTPATGRLSAHAAHAINKRGGEVYAVRHRNCCGVFVQENRDEWS